jgi:hypothetical protein
MDRFVSSVASQVVAWILIVCLGFLWLAVRDYTLDAVADRVAEKLPKVSVPSEKNKKDRR